MNFYPPPRKPSLWRRIGAVWLAIPDPVRIAVLLVALVLVACLSGCTSLSEIRPWFGVDLKDENTRMADPHWQDAGTLWLGFKALFN
jgi:hypothetical protein